MEDRNLLAGKISMLFGDYLCLNILYTGTECEPNPRDLSTIWPTIGVP